MQVKETYRVNSEENVNVQKNKNIVLKKKVHTSKRREIRLYNGFIPTEVTQLKDV